MARDMIVLEGNLCDEEVPLRVLFLYRGLPAITDDAGTEVVPTPQLAFSDQAKALLLPRELTELDEGKLAGQELYVDKPEGINDKEALRAYVKHLQSLYQAQRERFLRDMRNVYSLRGLVIDAVEVGGGI